MSRTPHRRSPGPLRTHALATLLLATLSACGGEPAATPPPDAGGAAPPAGGETPGAAAALSYRLPHDVSLPAGSPTLAEKQHAFDVFSWETFIALSWPADPRRRGQPNVHAAIDDLGPRVWETYKANRDLFLDPPVAPAPFNAAPSVPEACRQKAGEAAPVLAMTSKVSTAFDADTQAFAGETSWLIDQNGKLTHYEILTNEPEFDYVVAKQLYDSRVQARATDIRFPAGDHGSAEVGAVEVKAAWKELGPGDDPSTFYVREAYAYDAATDTCTGPFAAGLVGLHVAHKTATAPQWVWSTFEHVANAPSCRYPETGFMTCTVDFARAHYSFADPGCPDCPMNVLPTAATRDRPVQVVRVVPIPEATRAVNELYQGKLGASVFANYELVNTQWPTRPQGSPMGDPLPLSLANATMETYFQGTSPASESSSCIGCHFLAQTTRGTPDVKADFSFQLAEAYPHAGKE